MSAISNRYEFVIFFDVETAIPTATPMRAICPVSTRRLAMALSPTYA